MVLHVKQEPSRVTPQDTSERKVLTVGRTSDDSTHGCGFALKEKLSDTRLFTTDSLVVASGLME